MSMTQRYAGMLRRQSHEWDKQGMPVQAECARQAARHMEERERELQAEVLLLKNALWKACGDDKELVDQYIESQRDPRADAVAESYGYVTHGG